MPAVGVGVGVVVVVVVVVGTGTGTQSTDIVGGLCAQIPPNPMQFLYVTVALLALVHGPGVHAELVQASALFFVWVIQTGMFAGQNVGITVIHANSLDLSC